MPAVLFVVFVASTALIILISGVLGVLLNKDEDSKDWLDIAWILSSCIAGVLFTIMHIGF